MTVFIAHFVLFINSSEGLVQGGDYEEGRFHSNFLIDLKHPAPG